MLRDICRRAIILTGFVLLPAVASAQSSIAGVARDTSGAVLPGVTVEAASPALIEKVRTVVTNAQGRYAIVDLRPGVYTVTFALAGFGTVRREGIELPANFTAPVNVDLSVGNIAETVTVSGASPVVDVQSVARTQVVSREMLDTIPTGRSYRSVGMLIPGTKAGKPNIADVERTTATPTVRGTAALDTTVDIDGMLTDTLMSSFQQFHNDQLVQEVSYQTSALAPEVSGGGLRINIIPRDGGNTFSGGGFFSPIRGRWQSSNLTQELKDRGLAAQNRLVNAIDVNPWLAGPISRDRLWFLVSYRYNKVDRTVANNFYADGRPGISGAITTNYTARLTLQASRKDKITLLVDRVFRDLPTLQSSGTDPVTGSYHQFPRVYAIGQAKWTSPVTNRILVEAGYSSSVASYFAGYQPGIRELRGTPAWYAKARRVDTVRGTATTAGAAGNQGFGEGGQNPVAYQLSSAVSYVTGSHSFKTGVQWRFGYLKNSSDGNADLVQVYLDGRPSFVDTANTPSVSLQRLNGDLGIYAQDSWTLKRLTVNAGARLEYFNASIEEQSSPAGRFVPARFFERVPNVPKWTDVVPRLGVVYDVFGDGRTALKGSVSVYEASQGLDFARTYNPMNVSFDRRDWTDRDRLGRDLPTNGDDIAQDNEIGPTNNQNFGFKITRHPDPDIEREESTEYSVSVQRQLVPGVAVTGAWYRRPFYNLDKADNLLVNASDYTAFQVPSPLTGELITVYNLNRAKQGQVDILDTTSDTNRRTYTGFELAFSARLPRGGSLVGGWSLERIIAVSCDKDNPNQLRFCDERQLDIPFGHDVKLLGSYPLRWGVSIGGAFQSYAGQRAGVNWAVPASLFPGGRTESVTVPLVAPGKKFFERWSEVDVTVRKSFRAGRVELQPQVEIFNMLNSSAVLGENQSFGSRLGQPTEIAQGRLPRLALQVKW